MSERLPPRRYYFALTNLCNRACELCSCHSDPSRGTHLPFEEFARIVSLREPYEAQLEGGEPTIHPHFWRMVRHLGEDPMCVKLILCTNAVTIPHAKAGGRLDHERTVLRMRAWLERFAATPFLLKPSVNAHLVQREPLHVAKMAALLQAFRSVAWTHQAQLAFNLRRRPAPLSADGDQWLVDELAAAGLYEHCNDFLFQRYGKAEDEAALQRPFIVANPVPFHLFSPDGRDFGTDLVGRADHMASLP